MSARRILYLDLVGGAAGDMLLAALLDLGAPLEEVRRAIDALGLDGVTLKTREVSPAGLRALQLDVLVRGVLGDAAALVEAPEDGARGAGHATGASPHAPHHGQGARGPHRDAHASAAGAPSGRGPEALAHPSGPRLVITGPAMAPRGPMLSAEHHGPHRPYPVVRALLERAALAPRVRARALAVFRKLAEAEGLAHGVPLEEVTFHEVGADDALADVVGTCAALEALGVDAVQASSVPLGRGLTRGAHGPIPLPGPAVLALLAGAPLEETALRGETVTPTGAALLAALVERFGPIPTMTLERVGVGAGHKDWPDRPNVVRALLGVAGPAREAASASDEDCVVEANLDDMSPELFGALEAALFAAGALDVWKTPIQMKKGRLGVTVSALGRRALAEAMAEAFFVHSTTLGVRLVEVERRRLPRTLREVSTPFGPVRVKVSPRPSGPPLCAPEHDDCARAAEASGAPLRAVYEAALRAAWSDEGSGA
jgi:uncharacterized protein (TIGR00299 family) protein